MVGISDKLERISTGFGAPKKVNHYAVLVDGRRMLDKRIILHYEGIGL